jgi:hypothetical protein
MSLADTLPAPGDLRDRLIRRAERRVCDRIGPMGKLLVERSNALAQTWSEFVFLIGAPLDPSDRESIKRDLRELWDEVHK